MTLTPADEAAVGGPPAADDDVGEDEEWTSGESLVVGGHRPGLDGMRAVAMSFMLAYHSELPFARGAFLGLSQFFTLSGFLITGLLLRSNSREGINLKTFWSRRLRRLMPAALACLAGIVVFGATVATRQQVAELPGDVISAVTYTSNWYFIATDKSYIDLFAAPSPVQHYWSLAVEEQFYLLMPLALIGLFRWVSSPRVVAGVFAGAMLLSTAWMIFLYRSGAGLDRLYYGTDTRMAELLAGALLAVVLFHTPRVTRRALAIMGGVGVVAYALTAWGSATIPLADGPIWQGGFLVFSVVSCAVILGVVSERGPLSAIFSWGPLPAIGRITYGLYLYHWPIFLWLTPERTDLAPWPLFALRMALTFGIATASYHLLERPIRNGSTFGLVRPVRLAIAPVLIVVLIGAALVTADRTAPDPLETLQAADSSLELPVTPADGVLDLLVISDADGDPVVDRLEQLAAGDDATDVVRTRFSCSRITEGATGPVCESWTETWAALIEEHNPDLVLLYLDDWPADDLARLSGLPADDLPGFTAEVLASGLDILSSEGAPVLWSPSGASFEQTVARSTLPFFQAMEALQPERDDLRHVLGGRLPDPATVTEQQFLDQSAAALLADASLYQRAPEARLPRIMVVGDSQARSLGYGLERWGAEDDRAVVWNVATEGCGLADEGLTEGFGGAAPVAERCVASVASLGSKVETFDPDLVVVLSSIWDLQDRQLPGWDGLRTIADPEVRAYLRQEYDEVVDVLSAGGAAIVWMNAPCSDFVPVPGRGTDLPDAFDPDRAAALNTEVLAPLARDRPEVAELFDLDAAICPGGEYTNTLDGVEGIRSDGIHFSVDGALWFADTYGEDILEEAQQR